MLAGAGGLILLMCLLNIPQGSMEVYGEYLEPQGLAYNYIKDQLDNPPEVDRILGIWGSYYNIPKAIFYLHNPIIL